MEKFRRSLAAARQSGDALLQASDLGDIGYGTLQSRHYDQAVVSLQEAVNFATSVQARRQSPDRLWGISAGHIRIWGISTTRLQIFRRPNSKRRKSG